MASTDRTGSLGVGSGGGDPGATEESTTRFAAADISIVAPPQTAVGPRFQLAGVASIRMHSVHFIRVGGQSRTFEDDFYVTGGFSVTVVIDGARVPAGVVADGNVLRWSHDVVRESPGEVSVTVELHGTVTEEDTRTVGGKVDSHTWNRQVERSASRSFTIDTEPPKLVVTGIPETSIGPPYVTVIKGTAEDTSGVASVRWFHSQILVPPVPADFPWHHVIDGHSGSAEDLSADGSWARWRATVPLPDRRLVHEIDLVATDTVGHASRARVTVARDTTPPVVSRTDPPENPHRVWWRDGGVVVPVSGTTSDDQSKINAVSWQVDAGSEQQAEQMSDNWGTWRIQVALDMQGAHLVEIWAADMAGNQSPKQRLQIDVQVPG